MGLLYVVAAGNAFDGITLTGAFLLAQDAVEWANANVDTEWAMVEMEVPEAEGGELPVAEIALALQTRVKHLERVLHDLAEGARSKANVLHSGSPTAKYYHPVDILRALADEAEKALEGRTEPTMAELAQTLRAGYAYQDEEEAKFNPKSVWRQAVANDETVLGYWEWVLHQLNEAEGG